MYGSLFLVNDEKSFRLVARTTFFFRFLDPMPPKPKWVLWIADFCGQKGRVTSISVQSRIQIRILLDDYVIERDQKTNS